MQDGHFENDEFVNNDNADWEDADSNADWEDADSNVDWEVADSQSDQIL